MTNKEHIELLEEIMILTMNLIHDTELTGVHKLKVLSLLNSATGLNEPLDENRDKRTFLIKNKLDRLKTYYELNKKENG